MWMEVEHQWKGKEGYEKLMEEVHHVKEVKECYFLVALLVV